MGVDFLDMTFRLERSFAIKKLNQDDFKDFFDLQQRDIQAGRVHECVCRALVHAGMPIPKSSWHRVQICIAQAIWIPPKKIKPESWLFKDLGCS